MRYADTGRVEPAVPSPDLTVNVSTAELTGDPIGIVDVSILKIERRSHSGTVLQRVSSTEPSRLEFAYGPFRMYVSSTCESGALNTIVVCEL
jgi:hypothetical protein